MSSIMETQTPETPDNNNNNDADSNKSTVDASRPFHSVKEAVAIFGKRIFFTPNPETLHPSVIKKAVSVSPSYDEFTPSPGFELASPTYELKLSPEKSPTSSSPVSGKTPEEGSVVENGISDSSEHTTPTSEKIPAIVGVDKVMSDSSEKSLINVSKEAVNPSVYEPATPSPVNPKTPNKNYPYPSPSFSWEKGVSAPPTLSISSKEIEPLPSNETSEKDKQGKAMHGNDLVMMLMILKRLESQLQETKAELNLLKERESETEIALASLNAELHKNMSKIAKAEAAEAAKAASKSGKLVGESNREMGSKSRNYDEKERSKYDEVMIKQVDSPTLAQILSITDYDCYFENSQKLKKKMKKKPIIPLVTDIFPWWKKSNSTNSYAPLFYWH